MYAVSRMPVTGPGQVGDFDSDGQLHWSPWSGAVPTERLEISSLAAQLKAEGVRHADTVVALMEDCRKLKRSYKVPSYVDRDDLESVALEAVLRAIESYDGMGDLRLWGRSKMYWAVKDWLRKLDVLTRKERTSIRKAEEEGIDVKPSRSVTSLDRHIGDAVDSDDSLYEIVADPNAEAGYRHVEDVDEAKHILARMPERTREYVVLYVYGGMTMAQIGERYGVTESWVSRVISEAGTPPVKRPSHKGRRRVDWDRVDAERARLRRSA